MSSVPGSFLPFFFSSFNLKPTAAVAASRKVVTPEGVDLPVGMESATFRYTTTSAPEGTSAACVTCAGAGVLAGKLRNCK